MMVGSLLAFNACTKDGAEGPTGPAGAAGTPGAAGAAGAQGPIGPAGAKGADGTKILTGTGAPAASLGATGDYYFDKTDKKLYVKGATAWDAGTSLVGATGATGATGAAGAPGAPGAPGANGTAILSGAGTPTAANGNVGDFYFNTTNSTFVGPKTTSATDPWGSAGGSNVMPLGSAYSAKTYYLTRGFENVTPKTKTFGEVATVSYGKFDLVTTFKVTEDDMIRIGQYPGWTENREMIFESAPNSGVFNRVPLGGHSTVVLGNVIPTAGHIGAAPFTVGARFKYSNNTTSPNVTFDLTQDDITRLQAQNGNAFGYLTYAKATTSASTPGNNHTPANPNELLEGKTLNFASTKDVQVKEETTGNNYNATYTAQTKLDINSIPGLGSAIEKYKQEGKVYVKFKYFSDNTSGNNPLNHAGANAGWVDLSAYANSYVKAVNYGVDNVGTVGIVFPGPFATVPYSTATVTDASPFLGHNFWTSGQILGNIGTQLTVAANQFATAFSVVTGPQADRTQNVDGNVVINWNISSGTNFTNTATPNAFGPTTLTNTGNVADIATGVTPWLVALDGQRPTRTFETGFYSVPQLTSNKAISGANGSIGIIARTGGQPASYFANTKLVQVQVFVITGDIIKSAKAKGVDVNNADALVNFSKSVK